MDPQYFTKKYQEMEIPIPRLHVVLGSGFGSLLKKTSSSSLFSPWVEKGRFSFARVGGLKHTTVEGHEGVYIYFFHPVKNQSLCVQLGRLHGYEGYSPEEVVRPLIGPFLSGTSSFVLTNAAGALHTNFSIGSVMLINDHVNLTGKNPLYGESLKDFQGLTSHSRFLDLSHAYDKTLSEKIKSELKKQNLEVNEGLYLGLSGPSFETPAEIRLFQKWGLHAVGMSTVWEVIALKYLKAKVSALSMITNYGCGLKKEKSSLQETLDHKDVLENFKNTSKKILKSCFNLSSHLTEIK